ncbi:MAG: NRDE family protein [Candidatus Bathyarchaeota archaeon]|nr:NRDE family protein [Candidatus Bathyarchaeota archaeon]
MCTLIILYKLIKDYPIITLHNRYLGKDTLEFPPIRSGEVTSPIDVASKGTWIGFNRKGLLVAITNQETETLEKPGRSRGLLALDILRNCASAEEAKTLLLEPKVRKPYRSGNFVVETLMKVSADHACGRTESSICWHHPDFKQTSSTIIAVGDKPRVYYCLGNHCESPYTDYSNLVS